MTTEPPGKLQRMYYELVSIDTEEFWEVNDRESNLNYLAPSQREVLTTFFSWFDCVDVNELLFSANSDIQEAKYSVLTYMPKASELQDRLHTVVEDATNESTEEHKTIKQINTLPWNKQYGKNQELHIDDSEIAQHSHIEQLNDGEKHSGTCEYCHLCYL